MFNNKPWVQKLGWTNSRPRTIDDHTLVGLLHYLEYQAIREAKLEDAGFTTNESIDEVLYDFVLDALGLPANEEQNPCKNDEIFSREWFYELFYHDYLLEKEENQLTIEKVLSIMRREAANNLNVHYVLKLDQL